MNTVPEIESGTSDGELAKLASINQLFGCVLCLYIIRLDPVLL